MFETLCTDSNLNNQCECTINDMSALIKTMKRLVHHFDSLNEIERANIYFYDIHLFTIETAM